MIKFISLKNFQSHKNSTLEFCPYVNSIVAPSDSGKTTILRALNWNINNDPSGDAFVSQWALDEKGNQKEETVVTVGTNSNTIARTKKGKINTYTINNKILEAIGVGVPQEIQEAFNFSEVNIQKQMDAPFLLSNTPGEVARFFNKITKLDTIDTYFSAIEIKKRNTKTELDLAKTNKTSVEQELTQYTWIEQAANIIDRIKKLELQITTIINDTTIIKESIIEYTRQKQLLAQTNILPQTISFVASIEQIQTNISNICSSKSILSRLTDDYLQQKAILSFTKIIETTIPITNKIDTILKSKLNTDSLITYLSSSIKEYAQYKKILDATKELTYAEKLSQKIGNITDTNKNINSNKYQLEKEISTYKESKGVLEVSELEFQELQKELPSNCPYCGANLSDNHIDM